VAGDGEPDTLVSRGDTRSGAIAMALGTEPAAPPLPDGEDTRISSVYAFGEVIGRGGMGEVVLAHDRRIGRDVAIKRLHATNPTEEDIARFLREARIQARLDHPAIVPVYELARDEKDRPYFTMKRLSGVTLTDMLSSPAPTRQRLLRAFAEVCRAIDFAHTRGIVHRDLKPGNIVLGEFGEVYVLDWGVARVLDDLEDEVIPSDTATLEGTAPEGQVLGTPGYMAPEQLTEPEVGKPADIYSLGAILFEILAGEPVHPRKDAIAATLAGGDLSPSRRRPDRQIAPELDALCSTALATAPDERPSARRLADRIEAFLDGDRDVERRRSMAEDLLWSARHALDEGRRADAMRAAGRALALDPDTPGAAELVTALMLEPPHEPPGELVAAQRAAEDDGVRKHARTAILAYLAIASFLPIAAWNGIRNWPVVMAVVLFALAMATLAWRIRVKPQRSLAEMIGYAVCNAALLVTLSRMVGPFTFVPALACFMTMSCMSYPAFVRRPWPLILTIAIGFLLPVTLEALGLLGMTWELRDGELVSHAGALRIEGAPSVIMIMIASVVTIVIAGVHSAGIAKASRTAQQQLVTQAWHLQQLLPTTSGSIVTPWPTPA